MNVLITGNMGYVGSVLVPMLRTSAPGLRLIGLDCGWFADRLIGEVQPPEVSIDWQIHGDVRDPPPDLFLGIDAVIHLAAISNDPMGGRFDRATQEINELATIELARRAKEAGVGRFILASSCAMYGAGGEGGARTEWSALAPQTAYARSKVAAESALLKMDSANFSVRCLRFATAAGGSPRIRLDLVLNDFVASAIETGKITVLSDGTPWRPLIHVQDMCRALVWAVSDRAMDSFSINVGSNSMNFQVKDLAEAVAAKTGATVEINKDAAPDKLSCQVDFSWFEKLAPNHQPKFGLDVMVEDLVEVFQRFRPPLSNFREQPDFIRLNTLNMLVQTGKLDENLRWVRS